MLKWLKEEKEVPIQFKVVTQTSKEQSEILTDMCKKDYDRQQKAFKLEENKRRTERLKIGKDFVAKAPLPPYDPVGFGLLELGVGLKLGVWQELRLGLELGFG
jgi:hypothetical protein